MYISMKYMVKLVSLFLIFFITTHTTLAISKETISSTRNEAKALLFRAINLVEVNEVVAFTMMTIPNSGFQTKDLYPFCLDNKGVLLAHPYDLGVSIDDFVSDDGVRVGKEMLGSADYGKISEISYKILVFENGILTKKSKKSKKNNFEHEN